MGPDLLNFDESFRSIVLESETEFFHLLPVVREQNRRFDNGFQTAFVDRRLAHHAPLRRLARIVKVFVKMFHHDLNLVRRLRQNVGRLVVNLLVDIVFLDPPTLLLGLRDLDGNRLFLVLDLGGHVHYPLVRRNTMFRFDISNV